MINIHLLTVETNNGFKHWVSQRVSALIFLSILLVVYFTDSVVFGGLGLLFITSHINSGLETLIFDYMHDSLSKIYTKAILDVVVICLLKFIMLLFILV
jgi:succinate dehydrogenase hydrophobic anchor subunit|uniref:Succinate:cytochrome c oxidoreductase subunit 4 n=1 Tax=Baffinella frigidus TaxID=2571260 RepID=A0A6C0X6E6_9CRYP|nr:succinate:cytochrome c oxidoreductase subunit 4 [Cryptophyta sp. CCMP2293]